jgi:hypothetical protein
MTTMPMLSHSNSLMDDDPGIMSEAETSATGFRRGSKQRATLPVVRTPSKTLERPLGERPSSFRHPPLPISRRQNLFQSSSCVIEELERERESLECVAARTMTRDGNWRDCCLPHGSHGPKTSDLLYTLYAYYSHK